MFYEYNLKKNSKPLIEGYLIIEFLNYENLKIKMGTTVIIGKYNC